MSNAASRDAPPGSYVANYAVGTRVGDDHSGELVIPLLTVTRRWLHLPRVRAAVDGVVIASAVLLLTSVVRMAMDAFDQLTRVFG